MSRSGYSEDFYNWALIKWRGAVTSAIRGARGQAFLREMLAALDALPEKRLIRGDLIREDGEVCGMGAVCKARGIKPDVDPYDRKSVAGVMGIAPALAAEIAYINDDYDGWPEDVTPVARWRRVRSWVASQIKGDADE